MAMVKFGADEILRMDDSQGLTDESIDELLRKGEEKTEETHARIQKDMQVSRAVVLQVATLGLLVLIAMHVLRCLHVVDKMSPTHAVVS